MTLGYTLQSISNSAFDFIFNRYGCSISDEDNEVIITGGVTVYGNVRTTVSVYSEAGWQRDLSPLNQGRYLQACANYINRGKKVNHIFVCLTYVRISSC